ncbi:uncharacterized protein [Lepeophtheirus salmonis]|nr:rho GTPase-activating protein 29-like isoform X3 [Lepeophtheirus salmonis]
MASWLTGGGGKAHSSTTEGSTPSSPSIPKSVPPPSKPKKRERWLMTRKTWRYMADAGRHLIPEALRKGKDMKDYTDDDFVKLDDHFQQVCDQEREFIEWEGPLEDPRVLLARNRQPRAKNTEEITAVDYRYESLSAKFRLILPSGQIPPPGYVQVGTRRLPVGDNAPNIDSPSSPSSSSNYENYLRLPSGLIIQELPSAFLTERDWETRRCSTPSPPDSGVLSPDLADLDYDEDDGNAYEGRLGESGIGSGADSVKSKSKTMCVQTEPLPEEFYKIRDEEIRRKEEEERLAREAEERAQRESEELEASMMGDSVMRYLKMVRRNSKNADQKKAERFRSMNYDPTLRNIKAKYLYKDDEITTKSVEVQCDESILHLLKQCESPVDSLPYFWDRRMSQASSSPGATSPPMRRFSGDKDFYSHLYSGDMTGLEAGSVQEDYYHYLETWYRAQRGIQSTNTNVSHSSRPPQHPQVPSPTGIYIPVSTLQNLRSSMPTLSSTAAVTSHVSRSTTSLSGHSTTSPKSLFSSVLGKSTSSLSKKLRPHGRSKSQSISSISTSSWCPQTDHRWNHSSSKSIQLEDTNVLLLHELERVALQKLSCQKLNASDLGVSLRIPKDSTDTKPKRKNNFIKKRVLSSAKRERDKPPNPTFGLPLSQCVPESSLPLSGSRPIRKRSSTVEPFSLTDDPTTPSSFARASRSGSRTSFGSIVLDKISSPHHSTGSCESLTTHFDFHRANDSLSAAAEDLVPSVPKIVIDCITHIEHYGLRTVGIFRVSSSKKRVRQLRESFENGCEGILTEETSVHDVGTLLKEFFRDLPEPIIPHELLTALITVTQIKTNSEQIYYLQRLMHILPLPNRDTLFILLQFLGLIAENAEDKLSDNGEIIPGNKMDSVNLATLFAPNLLHSFKIDEKNANANKGESNDYICLTKLLIDQREAIFDIPAEQLHDLYVYLSEHFPDLLDALLKRRLLLSSGEELTEEDSREKQHPELESTGTQVENLTHLHSLPSPQAQQQPQQLFQLPHGPERGRTRRRKTSTGSSSVDRTFKNHPKATSPSKDADFHRWTFNLKSLRHPHSDNSFPVSRGSIKFSTPEMGPPRGCMTNTTTTISPSSRMGEAFFGSGQSTPSAQTDPGSPPSFSPPISPPPLTSTITTTMSPVTDVLLVLNPVPPRTRKKTPTGSTSPPTIVEEEAPPTPRPLLSPIHIAPPSPPTPPPSPPAPPSSTATASLMPPSEPNLPTLLSDRRAKTDNLENYISELEKLPTVASDSCLTTSRREMKRYTRRRYTDSRHPTRALPDVRLEVASEMSVRKPPVRKTHLTVEK